MFNNYRDSAFSVLQNKINKKRFPSRGLFDSENLELKLRSDRNKLLQQSDWTQTVDCPLSDTKRAEWATYRQQLRDFMLTHNESTINSWEDYDAIVWPTKPE